MATADKRDPKQPEDSRVAWYVMLEDARRRHDFAGAVHAEDELRRLGVRVRFTRVSKAVADAR